MVEESTKPVQISLFEDDYLLRSLGALSHSPDSALTELVANAWDAGASKVSIIIPETVDQLLIIEDDGVGMTKNQFSKRWMVLGYNRQAHQGANVEFPPNRAGWSPRRAFGRNGVGRHGMLCFAGEYDVETKRDGKVNYFRVSTCNEKNPFVVVKQHSDKSNDYGTKLSVRVQKNLPSDDQIREILAARFLFDPQFNVEVNGKTVPLSDLPGFIEKKDVDVGGIKIEVLVVESSKASRNTRQSGVAFWIDRRLVGKPSWIWGDHHIIDGRTAFGKRYAIIIRSSELHDEVRPDWSGFKHDSRVMEKVYSAVEEYVQDVYKRVSAKQIKSTKADVYRENRTAIEDLERRARKELVDFVDYMTDMNPTLPPETLSVAVQAVINLEQARNGQSLLKKLSELSDDDVTALDRLLDEWSINDALSVLDEIDRRLSIITTIEKLSGDARVDELHTLHPLVTEARWVFGPEFDTPEYASNVSLRNVAKQVLKKKDATTADFINSRKRPDLVITANSTYSVVGTESFGDEQLPRLNSILIIELKKGQSTIGRNELNQASNYVEDFLNSGHIEGCPSVRAFVVGHVLQEKVSPVRTLGNNNEGQVNGCTFGRLVRAAEKRLFNLKSRLQERYDDISEEDILSQVLKTGSQNSLPNT